MRTKTGPKLFIGIASNNDTLEMVALESGHTAATMKFPAGKSGIEAVKGFLSHYGTQIRVAVAGVAAVSLAMALGDAPKRETVIVSPSIASQAASLAHYAEHMV